jgi:hypothetical protein
MNTHSFGLMSGLILCCNTVLAQSYSAHNPIIYADFDYFTLVIIFLQNKNEL